MFLTRFAGGFGAGVISSACLMVHAMDVDERTENMDSDQLHEEIKKGFIHHYASEAIGFLVGPLVIVAASPNRSPAEIAAYLSAAILAAWLITAILMMTDYFIQRSQPAQEEEVLPRANLIRRVGSFVRNLLYSDVPFTAYFNKRAALAITALFMQWILATYFLSYYTLLGSDRIRIVACQFSLAMGCSAATSLVSNLMSRLFGKRTMTLLALTVSSGSCFFMEQ